MGFIESDKPVQIYAVGTKVFPARILLNINIFSLIMRAPPTLGSS